MSRDEEATRMALESVRKDGVLPLDENTPSGSIMMQRVVDRGLVEYDPDTGRLFLTGYGLDTLRPRDGGKVLTVAFPRRFS